ncbi:hypothetical protein OG250_07360 [Streptomyces sp. NBC_00487]|uniref:hypothetical protein n=1 Tax=Streptomyces TaxID=1883 RepID=UPI00099C338A|nr:MULTISPECIES: hypothetical protein [Streptomyces]
MATEHPVDALVVDTSKEDKIGYVMGNEGPYVQLRAPGGGVEWDANPDKIRPATETEALRARVTERNRAQRFG